MKTNVKNPQNKRVEKKQVNIVWNSRLFFQIGIIISCLIVFFVMQTSFEVGTPVIADQSSFGIEEPPMVIYQVDVEKPELLVPVKTVPVKPITTRKPVKSETFKVEDNTSDVVETPVLATDIPIIEHSITDVPQPIISEPSPSEPTGPSSILNVEFVPVYPGCEGLSSNAETIDCLSSRINTFLNRNFSKEVLENLYGNEVQKVYVQFKVDSQGFITDVRTNSTNQSLEREAKRVIAKLPRMKPGRQGDKNVDVLYTLPITFRIP